MSVNYLLPGVITTPSALEITAISQTNPAVITVSANSEQTNTYQPGQLIRMDIPYEFGMWQIANKTLNITAVNSNNITVGIDATPFDPFVIPAITATQPASISPAGSRNLAIDNNTQNVPFKSLNDVGN